MVLATSEGGTMELKHVERKLHNLGTVFTVFEDGVLFCLKLSRLLHVILRVVSLVSVPV